MTTVSLVLRENLIEKAKIAKNEYERAAQNESDQLDELENAINNIDGPNTPPAEDELTTEDIVALYNELIAKILEGDTNGAQNIEANLKENGEDPDDLILFVAEEQNITFLYSHGNGILMRANDLGQLELVTTEGQIKIANQLYEIAVEFDKLFADGEVNYYRSIEYNGTTIKTTDYAGKIAFESYYNGYRLETIRYRADTRFIGIYNFFGKDPLK